MTAARTKASDAYHHGDLREGLLAAAREALETSPPEAITLKALAVRLGVSQPAPYRHFANREALCCRRWRKTAFAASPMPCGARKRMVAATDAMDRSLAAYVRFAAENRGRVSADVRLQPHARRRAGRRLGAEAADAAFAILLNSVQDRAPPERARAVAVWIWASLHGVVMLESEGLLAGPNGPLPVADVVAELAAAVRARL